MGFPHRDRRAWQRGEIDDVTFERRAAAFAWSASALIFGAVTVVGVLGLAVEGADVERLLFVAGMIAVLGLVFGLWLSGWAVFGVREQIITKQRQRIESNPALPLVAPGTPPGDVRQFFGPHRRSRRWAYTVMGLGLSIGALMALLMLMQGRLGDRATIMGAVGLGVFCWGLYQRLDSRPYLDISSEGLWCRRWGPKRIAFSEFKAVYGRRSGLNIGIVLVPRSTADLKAKLSWLGKLSLRSGDFGGTAAHIGTLTFWTNRLELPHESLLTALQSEIVRTVESNPPP